MELPWHKLPGTVERKGKGERETENVSEERIKAVVIGFLLFHGGKANRSHFPLTGLGVTGLQMVARGHTANKIPRLFFFFIKY